MISFIKEFYLPSQDNLAAQSKREWNELMSAFNFKDKLI